MACHYQNANIYACPLSTILEPLEELLKSTTTNDNHIEILLRAHVTTSCVQGQGHTLKSIVMFPNVKCHGTHTTLGEYNRILLKTTTIQFVAVSICYHLFVGVEK